MSDQSSPAPLERVVRLEDTAAALDARLPAAASTPFVLSLVEGACHLAVLDELGEDEVTVGAHVSLDHLEPSPVGALLSARAKLEESGNGRYTWSVEVFEGDTVAARARHVRVRVPKAAIDAQLAAKTPAT